MIKYVQQDHLEQYKNKVYNRSIYNISQKLSSIFSVKCQPKWHLFFLAMYLKMVLNLRTLRKHKNMKKLCDLAKIARVE